MAVRNVPFMVANNQRIDIPDLNAIANQVKEIEKTIKSIHDAIIEHHLLGTDKSELIRQIADIIEENGQTTKSP